MLKAYDVVHLKHLNDGNSTCDGLFGQLTFKKAFSYVRLEKANSSKRSVSLTMHWRENGIIGSSFDLNLCLTSLHSKLSLLVYYSYKCEVFSLPTGHKTK